MRGGPGRAIGTYARWRDRNGLSGWWRGASLGRVEVVAATQRLVVHAWRDVDREPFAALNANPEVMRYFPSTLSVDLSSSAGTRPHTLDLLDKPSGDA